MFAFYSLCNTGLIRLHMMKEKINGVLVALDNEDRSTKKHLLVQIKRFNICLIIKNNNIIFVYFIFIFE